MSTGAASVATRPSVGHDGAVATRSFVLDALVGVAPEAAIEFLGQFDRHRGLHAYLQSAERVAQGTGAEGDWAE